MSFIFTLSTAYPSPTLNEPYGVRYAVYYI